MLLVPLPSSPLFPLSLPPTAVQGTFIPPAFVANGIYNVLERKKVSSWGYTMYPFLYPNVYPKLIKRVVFQQKCTLLCTLKCVPFLIKRRPIIMKRVNNLFACCFAQHNTKEISEFFKA